MSSDNSFEKNKPFRFFSPKVLRFVKRGESCQFWIEGGALYGFILFLKTLLTFQIDFECMFSFKDQLDNSDVETKTICTCFTCLVGPDGKIFGSKPFYQINIKCWKFRKIVFYPKKDVRDECTRNNHEKIPQ